MESTNNNNNNQLFLCEFKELRKELSAVKKRIVQLEESQEKQQEKIDILERENYALKTQLNINSNKEGGLMLKTKKADQDDKDDTLSKNTSVSDNKKNKTHNNNNDNDDDDETVVIPQHDNGDSFDSLSDDLLHKIVEFDGNCYSKFGSINKRCKNIYDVKEYKLIKETCLYGYGTVEMMLQHYLQRRRRGGGGLGLGGLGLDVTRSYISDAVIYYNRLDAIDWIIQLGDRKLLGNLCWAAVLHGSVKILIRVFCKCNLTMLDNLLSDNAGLCYTAADYGHLELLKWLRKYGAHWDANTFIAASANGHDEMVQYLLAEGCPEQHEERDESSGSEQLSSDDEDGDY